MSTLLALGLANAGCAALLAIPAYLVGRYGRRPALAHALWLLVLLKLVTPPVLRPGLPWLPPPSEPGAVVEKKPVPPTPFTWALTQPPRPVERPVAVAPLVLQPHPVVTKQATATFVVHLQESSTPPVPPPTAVAEPAPVEDRGESLVRFALVVWLCGAVASLAWSLRHVLSFHRLLVHGRLAPEDVQQQARELATDMGMSACPPIWLVPGPLPPMVWGLGRVRILFPEGLVDRLGREERASLLTHELAHVARRDHWVRLVELLAASLFWWYPLVWWARRQLHEREEECCDAWAKGAASPRVYATAILEAVDFLSEARPRLPAMASALAGVQALKERLTLILTTDVPRRLAGPTRMGLVCLGAALLPLMPTLVQAKRQVPKEPPQEEQPAKGMHAVHLLKTPSEVFSVAFSRDGKRVATGTGGWDRPGAVELFDVASKKMIGRTAEPRGVSSVSFAPDGKRLAWAGWSGVARISDLATLQTRFSIPLADRNVRVRYSDDGKWLAAATEGRQLQLLDAATGKKVYEFKSEGQDFYCVNFSSDSKLLGAGGGSYQGVSAKANWAFVIDVQTKRKVARLEGHTRAVVGLAFAAKNELIATGSVDNTVRVWDGKSFKLRNVLLGHTDVVHGVAFSPDNSILATGSRDGSVRLWDPRAGKQLAKLVGHPGEVQDLAFSPDGRLLVSGGEMRSVKLWDVLARKELATLSQDVGDKPPSFVPVAMELSADGSTLALGGERGTLLLLDGRTGERLHSIEAHADAVTTLAFSRDGKRLASSGPDAVVKLWDAGTGKLVREFKGHGSWVYSLAFSRDGKYLASGEYDRAIRVWSVATGEAKVLTGHRASVRTVAFTNDGKTLVSGGGDKTIRIWNLSSKESKAVLKGHDGAVRSLVLAEGGKAVISAGEDGALKRWDLATGSERVSRASPNVQYVTLALSSGDKVLAAGKAGGATETFDAVTLAPAYRFPGAAKTVLGLAFSPDAQSLYQLDGQGALRLWPTSPKE